MVLSDKLLFKNNTKAVERLDYSLALSLVREMRPKQWTKNVFVFAAILFSGNLLQWHLLFQVILGFIAFSLISSTVYIINDILDVEKDRQHPEKSQRPIASGALPVKFAAAWASVLGISAILISLHLNPQFLAILIIYFLVNIAYSLKLKHVVLVDVMLVALGFVLRAISGAVIINVRLTSWFLICALLLSLFLALSKRRHELVLFQEDSSQGRQVLEHYSTALLDQLISIVTAMTIMAYALYTFTSGQPREMVVTVPFVIYGIFRYLYLVHMQQGGGSPERTLLEDKHILFTVISYGLVVFIILRYF